jgi:predicted nucleic acid-binding protein
MSLVYWDSMLFVYLVERHAAYFSITKSLHEAMKRRGDTLCTSIVTVGEVLVGPRKLGSQSGADRIVDFFAARTVRVLPFDMETAIQFSFVRAWTTASPPDAIHLASAAQAQVDLFFTNDRKLLSLQIPGIARIASLDLQTIARLLP